MPCTDPTRRDAPTAVPAAENLSLEQRSIEPRSPVETVLRPDWREKRERQSWPRPGSPHRLTR